MLRTACIPLLLAVAALLPACAGSERLRTPDHVHVNALDISKSRNGYVVHNLAAIRPGNASRNPDQPRPTPLATSRSEQMLITILSPAAASTPDPVLLERAMKRVQQDWRDLKTKYTDSPLSIDLWLIPPDASFQHRSTTKLRDGAPLHLTFAVSSLPGKPAHDVIATSVETLSHELYHVARIGQPEEDVLAEEVNATGWGFCSNVRFAMESTQSAAFQFHVQAAWKDRVELKPDGLLVRVPPDAKDPVGRSLFGQAVFYQYLAALIGSPSFHTDNPDHVAVLSRVCKVVSSAEIPVRSE